MLGLLMLLVSSAVAATLNGSSEYAVPGVDFTLMCDVPEEATSVRFYRRIGDTTTDQVGSVQFGGTQCYNTQVAPAVICTLGVCSCESSRPEYGTSFQWIIQAQTGDHSSVWYCATGALVTSPDYTLKVAVPVTSVQLQNPPLAGQPIDVTDNLSTTNLVCVTSACRPSASVLWLIGETNYTSSSVQSVQGSDLFITTSTMTFTPTRAMTEQKVVCMTYNIGVVVQATLQPLLNVRYPSETTATLNVTSTNFQENEQISIMCQIIGGNPLATITWNCFGGTTSDVSTSVSRRSVTSLTANRGQNGRQCQCAGTQPLATITNVSVTFYIQYGPSTVTLSPATTSYNKNDGENISTITCSADCNPACTYSWTKGGLSYTTGATVQFTSIQRGKAGVYSCSATNTYGTKKSGDVTITVNYGPSTVTLSPATTSYNKTEGENISTITCSGDCNPACTYSWTKGGLSYTTGATVQFTSIQRGKAGVYSCSAANTYGIKKSGDVTITVNYGPGTSIALSPPATSYTNSEGDTLPPITCSADCRPSCTFVWRKPDGTNFPVAPMLSLEQLHRSEHGTYTCTARNGAGQATISTNVTVQYVPGAMTFTPSAGVVDTVENQTIPDVTCYADCRPACTYTWSKGGTNYANPLSLSKAVRGNAGQYVCTATNIVGQNTKTWNLTVKYPSETTATLNVTSANFQENEQISIMCHINGGNPLATITWNCFGGTTSDVSTFVSRRSVTSLTANRGQNGRQCQCAGTQPLATITNVSVTFAIQYGPSTVTLSPATTSYNKTEGENISTISCSADCNPACTYSWIKGGQLHTTGASLQFTNIQRGEAGGYSCSATNTYGTKKSGDVTITVNYPSETTATLNVTSANFQENEQISIMCQINGGNPLATITWNCFGGTTSDVSTFVSRRSVTSLTANRGQNGRQCQCAGTQPLATITNVSVTFAIQYGPSTVTLSPATTSYNKTEGENISTISCSADCNPACTYSWIKGGQLHTTGASLQFTNIQRGEAGGYSCSATNTYGTKKSGDVTITVNYGPGAMTFIPSAGVLDTVENQTSANVSCSADCRPACTYTWSKGGTNYANPLSLSKVVRCNAGQYVCTATNIVGQNTKTWNLIVKYGPGTSIALSPAYSTYTKNESDTLPAITCMADCRPNCTFAWRKPDGTNLADSPVLSLGQLNRSEHGTYTCTAQNGVGTAMTISTRVTVQYGPGTSIALSPPATSYTRNESVTLPAIICTADCIPSCSFVWRRPDSTTLSSAVLSLGQLEKSEHGTYACTAQNGIGDAKTISTSVTVQYRPGDITFTPSSDVVDKVENQTILNVTCDADCRPACTYTWSKGGTNYANPLSLSKAVRGNAGQYVCTATNIVGQNTKTWNLTVKYGPGTSIALSPAYSTYTKNESDTLPAITCMADCRPNCTFAWRKPDGTNLADSPVLSLGQLNRSEHGTYTCTAQNGVGTAMTISTRVTVQYGPGTSIALSPPATSYTRNESVTLPAIICTADCIPSCSFVWRRPDSTTLSSAVLSLGQLEKSEHGTYACTAQNGIGDAKTISTSVTVQYRPGDITFTPSSDVVDKVENQTILNVTCDADCRPACTYTWSKGGTNYANPLSLSKAVRGNAGQYVCTATNIVGQNTKTWNLTVKYGPGTSIALSPAYSTYTKNESDTLPAITCMADCRPNCTFAWRKPDGTNLADSPVLSLGQLNRSEHGTYTCTAQNGVGTAMTISTRVTVQYGPGTSIALSPPATSYTRNESVTLPAIICTADCIPSCSFVWRRPDSTTLSSAVLSLGQLEKSEHGTYACTAQNGIGDAKTISTSVTVQYRPGDITFTPSSDVVDKVENQTILNVTCDADCRPACTYTWSKGGTNYANPLSLSKAVRGNAGQYVCTATNIVGQNTKTWNLTVKSEPTGPTTLSLGAIIGGISVVAVAIAIIVIIMTVLKRRAIPGKWEKDEMIQINGRRVVDEGASDGLNANILYESSGPMPGSSSEYAVVDKTAAKKAAKNGAAPPPEAVHAVVDKSKKPDSMA